MCVRVYVCDLVYTCVGGGLSLPLMPRKLTHVNSKGTPHKSVTSQDRHLNNLYK